MKNVEEDVIRLTSGQDTGDMYYQTITGLKQALSSVQPAPSREQRKEKKANLVEDYSVDQADHSNSAEIKSERSTDGDEENLTDSEGSSSETESQAPVDKKAARKENKKKVKEEKREARKNKVPKAVKKRKKKLAKAHKTR